MKATRALILAPLIFLGCANLSSPSASADLTRGDPFQCAETGDRWCIGKLWIYLKFRLNL